MLSLVVGWAQNHQLTNLQSQKTAVCYIVFYYLLLDQTPGFRKKLPYVVQFSIIYSPIKFLHSGETAVCCAVFCQVLSNHQHPHILSYI